MRMIHEITLLALLRYAILAAKPDIVVSQIDETKRSRARGDARDEGAVVVCEVTDAVVFY